MLQKVMRGIKATIHGGTKYERSVKKTLKNDDAIPKEKHLQRIVNGVNDQDIETGVIKAEQIFESKLEEAKQEDISSGNYTTQASLSMKILLVMDMVADQKLFWTGQDEQKLSAWIIDYFLDRHPPSTATTQNNSNNIGVNTISRTVSFNQSIIKQPSISSKQLNIIVTSKTPQVLQSQQPSQFLQLPTRQAESPSSFQEIESSENTVNNNGQIGGGQNIFPYQNSNSNHLVFKYSVYVLEKVKVLNDLRSYVSGQLSAGGTPLEEFFGCFSRLEQFEELIANLLQSLSGLDEKQKAGVVKVVSVSVFGSECCLFGLMLVLVALFAERCCLNAGRLSLARLIDAVGGLLQRARRFVSVLKASSEILAQFQLLIYKLQISLLSSEFSQIFSHFVAEPTIYTKTLTMKLKAASLDFATIALNLENKSAFANLLRIHFQDLLSEYDTNRTFAKLETDKTNAADPFENYQNVYSAPIQF